MFYSTVMKQDTKARNMVARTDRDSKLLSNRDGQAQGNVVTLNRTGIDSNIFNHGADKEEETLIAFVATKEIKTFTDL